MPYKCRFKCRIKIIFPILIVFLSFILTRRTNNQTQHNGQQASQANRLSPKKKFTSLAKQIERGKYFTRAGNCFSCHTLPGATPYSGNVPILTPFGTIYSSNLTPDDETGIGRWSNDDFYLAMHEGISKDGSYLYPAFPFAYYTKMSHEDIDAIYAYLKSLSPTKNIKKENQMPFPFNKRIILLGWRILFFKKGEFKADLRKSDEYNRGSYLVEGPMHCGMCHTPTNWLGAQTQSKKYSGSLIPMQNWFAPPLHSDKKTGIGKWSAEDIRILLKTGVSRYKAAYGPMEEVIRNSTQYLTNEDLLAAANYLLKQNEPQSSPQKRKIEATEKFSNKLVNDGGKLYSQNCSICHNEQGTGSPPHYPPLAGNSSVQMDQITNITQIILNGGTPPSTKGNPDPYGMPPFKQRMDNYEIASIISYIRSAWGNNAKPVMPKEIERYREKY